MGVDYVESLRLFYDKETQVFVLRDAVLTTHFI